MSPSSSATASAGMAAPLAEKPAIRLRGARMHNLQGIDLDLPLGELIVMCGVSGSGKTSLAIDTLYAEGQRRFIESLSPQTRQFLPQPEKPAFDRLEHLPASIAVRRSGGAKSNRHTVGTVSEIDFYLRVLFTRAGQAHCPNCGTVVERYDPARVADWISGLSRRRAILAIPTAWTNAEELAMQLAEFQSAGFTRWVVGGKTWHLASDDRAAMAECVGDERSGWIVVDRVMTGENSPRLQESIETAYSYGSDSLSLFVEVPSGDQPSALRTQHIDGQAFALHAFSRERVCEACDRRFSELELQSFNFNSPIGACPACEGTGEQSQKKKEGDSPGPCPLCHGRRLKAESLAVTLFGKSIADLLEMPVAALADWLAAVDWSEEIRPRIADAVRQIESRLRYLMSVGLSYLALHRPMRTLSGGEACRVRLTNALGSDLVSMLYVLDEPTMGLHPHDTLRLVEAIEQLRDRGNTMVVIEHEPWMMRRADRVIEIGPSAGEKGGRISFQGTYDELIASSAVTAPYLSGPITAEGSSLRKETASASWLRLDGASGRNLQHVSIAIPLGCLCVVTGVSGSGKSSLIVDTLVPALQKAKGLRHVVPLPYQGLSGDEALGDCRLIDHVAVQASRRSNLAIHAGLFDELRQIFAETNDAKRLGYGVSHFSFNNEEGACPRCKGLGILVIDMHFLSDLEAECPECHGSGFRREVLQVRYRDRSLDQCLAWSIAEARPFFRGVPKLQKKLDGLIKIGLGYVPLGQRLSTLSQGELQRLKLAGYLSEMKKEATLFVMDEPTAGLHFADIDRLLMLMRELVDAGHSVLAIEHNLQWIRASDYVIDLGPGAAAEGGRIVACGTPEAIQERAESLTGKCLAGRLSPRD